MPSFDHEAPLAVLRSDPAVVAELLSDALGIAVPPFASAEEASADFSQVSALHARLERPTCLLVLALDESTAHWASTPITSLQLGSPFVPLVIGPAHVPRVDVARAARQPSLGVLSALAHGNNAGGVEIVRAAIKGLAGVSYERASVFFDLIRASVDDAVWRLLENDMDYANYKWKSDFFRKDIDKAREEGREEGRLIELRKLVLRVARARIGDIEASTHARIDACEDVERLEKLVLDLSTAGDPAAVEKLLFELD